MLLEMIQNDGFKPKRKTPGEYASACPRCGGSDRFVIFTDTDKFWCRQCGVNGDAMQYLTDFHNMTYPEAAEAAGKAITPLDRANIPAVKAPEAQPGEWRDKAKKLVAYGQKQLAGNQSIIDWLKTERGITPETARRFSLGWLNSNFYQQKSEWGMIEDGKKMFIPSGLVIPWQEKRIRIRRHDPGEYGRYHVLSGSTAEPMTIGTAYETTGIVVESELDAILLSQEIKRKVFIVAMGSCSHRPDDNLIQELEQCPVILIAMDTDEAGAKAAQWWLDNVPGSHRTLTPKSFGKDITAAFLNGLDLNEWLSVSMEMVCEEILSQQAQCATNEPT